MDIPVPGRREVREEWFSNQNQAVGARAVRGAVPLDRDIQGSPGGTRPTQWPLNSSATDGRRPSPHDAAIGHRHLLRLLAVHGVLRSDGVAAAFRLLTAAQIDEAIAACEYFDLHHLAAMVASIPPAASSPLSARVFDAEYHRQYSTTEAVVTAIRTKITTQPCDFPYDRG